MKANSEFGRTIHKVKLQSSSLGDSIEVVILYTFLWSCGLCDKT